MTRDVLLAHIAKLDKPLQDIYFAAESYAKEAADTLTNDFQLSATVTKAFELFFELRQVVHTTT